LQKTRRVDADSKIDIKVSPCNSRCGPVRLSDTERRTLAEIGKRLGRKLLCYVACVAKREAILGWYRRLIARKFDGSKHRSQPGRRVSLQVEALIFRMAPETPVIAT
jgi:putative transposase